MENESLKTVLNEISDKIDYCCKEFENLPNPKKEYYRHLVDQFQTFLNKLKNAMDN